MNVLDKNASLNLNSEVGQRLLILIVESSNVKTLMDRMSLGLFNEVDLNKQIEETNQDIQEFCSEFNQDIDELVEFLESYAVVVD